MLNNLFVLFFILISIETIAQSHLINEEEWYLWQKDNIKIYVHEFGQGDTIIVLHGGYGAEHSYLLDFLIPLQKQFHFVLFDQRGALRSPVPDSLMKESITMDTYLNDLETLRKEMNLQEIDILAHSMGAHYAYHYLTVFPAHMGELTVISGFIPKWPDENEMLILQESQKERANFMQRQALSEKIKSIDNNPDLGPHKKKSYQWKIKYAAGQIYNLENWKR